MTADRLKRVVWLLRERFPGKEEFMLNDLRKAIMEECGVDERTIKGNIKALIEIGYLTRRARWYFKDNGIQY